MNAGDIGNLSSTTENVLTKLRENNVAFQSLEHEETKTSQESCDARIKGGWTSTTLAMGAKAMVVKSTSTGEFFLIVLQADAKLNNKKLAEALQSKNVKFASEDEVLGLSACKPGAVPPFGSLFSGGMVRTYVDAGLRESCGGSINFNCGANTLSLQIQYQDFENIEKPTVIDVKKSIL